MAEPTVAELIMRFRTASRAQQQLLRLLAEVGQPLDLNIVLTSLWGHFSLEQRPALLHRLHSLRQRVQAALDLQSIPLLVTREDGRVSLVQM